MDVEDRVVEFGGESELVAWAIEFGRLDGYDQLVLCLKVKLDSGLTYIAGPVVGVWMTGRKHVDVVLESTRDSVWCRVNLSFDQYNIGLHLEWLLTEETSVISVGMFPKVLTAEKVHKGIGFPIAELYNGFQYVKHFIVNDQSGMTLSPNTWIVDQICFEEGARSGSNIGIYSKIVFVDQLDRDEVQAYIAAQRTPQKDSGKKRANIDTDIPSKVKKAAKGETPRGTIAKNTATKSQSKPVLALAAPNRETSGPKVIKAAAKQVPTAAKKNRPSKSETTSVAKKKRSRDSETMSAANKKRPSDSASTSPNAAKQQLIKSTESTILSCIVEKDDVKVVEEKKVKEGSDLLAKISRHYIWGIQTIFKIPVKLIRPAPPQLCYRKLNMEHVGRIAESMVTSPGVEPLVADLIPFNLASKKLVDYMNTPKEKKAFLQDIEEGRIHFYAVSGQHSAKAAQKILEWSSRDPNYQKIARSLEYRKARILSAQTPHFVLAEHSSRCNAANVTMEANFLDSIIHARRQYIACDRPAKPLLGNNNHVTLKNPEYKKFNVSFQNCCCSA
jgi:hypothetical protein